MFQDVTIDELLRLHHEKELQLVDVRSPSEFAEGSIPGSVNVPLFDDEERKEIGTIYNQIGFEEAKQRGLEIVSAKLPAFIREIEAMPGRKGVFCWRGGMRSRTSATLLSLMGQRPYRLIGGVRSYRKWVVDMLEHYELKAVCVSLNGYTGSGKTHILRTLQERGYPVIDLEGMAQHRGSIFGQIGLEPNNQKTFESLLASRLVELGGSPYVLIEAESKRVGKAVVPDFLMEGKDKGIQLFLEMPTEERVRNIIADYEPQTQKAACIEAFSRIKRNIHTPIAAEIQHCLEEERFPEAVRLLLEYYYDPKYEHTMSQFTGERVVLRVRNTDEAVEAVANAIRKLGLA